jgi:thiamine-phosphate diphosphorylase
MQLRIKDLSGVNLANEIAESVAMCRKTNTRLFINDYWQLAIDSGAYGVHLGQEDLDQLHTENLSAISNAGLRLGVSTHSHEEALRAMSVSPSYIALGPIFPTTCKSMAFGPQGLARIGEWRSKYNCPLVAIGGLKVEHAAEALALGADGIAVISDITTAADPEGRARQWVLALGARQDLTHVLLDQLRV